MSPLDLVPGLGALRALGISLMVGGAATIAGGLLYFQPKGERLGESRVQARWNAAELERLELARQAELAARNEEQRRTTEQREALDEAERLATRARAGAAGAARADRLLDAAVTATIAGSGLRAKDPATAGSCSAADETSLVLADLFGRARARLRELGEYADQAADAGLTCERSYSALIPRAELTVTGTAPD